MDNIKDLFSKDPIQLVEEPHEESEEEAPYASEELSAAQIKDRESRTIFVGNISIKTDKKLIIKHFKQYGKIEKLWIRSVPVEHDNKMSKKARVITKKYHSDFDTKNAYILFAKVSEAEESLKANGTKLEDNTLRVNFANKNRKDYKKSIFIGNLVYNVKEEDFRTFFSTCGEIENIRIIRDKQNYKCKGFAYITFKDKLGFYNGLKMDGKLFEGRELRVKKALREKELVRQESLKAHNAKNKKRIIKPKRVLQSEENLHFQNNISKKLNVNEDFSNATLEQHFNHKPNIPQSIINKKIKKLKKGGLTKEEYFQKQSALKAKELEKLNKNILIPEKLLEKRRTLRKNKMESNKKKYSPKNILK